ncbi:hypothetical protein B0H10DRAFT_821120 [Mycena sp. CBHHK59/15]|nr:hypothetical protein B0H10DRAFT_821120 [Mycena sp. CBHHK59/15]
MRSLDEMRPKMVELTSAKAELGETVAGLEHTVRSRDAAIAQLEADADELRDQKEQAEQRLADVLGQREKDRALAQASTGELQKAYADLREELDLATDSVRALETERAGHRAEIVRRLEELDALTVAGNAQADELAALRRELAERRTDQDEEQDFLTRAQNEIEALRVEVAARDDELSRLRTPTTTGDEGVHALDTELLGSLRAQHALELSAAQSQIRALENTVFDAEARAHALRRQVAALEDQVAQPRRAMSPSLAGTSRPASRAGSTRPGAAPPLSRTVFDGNLSAETRHKRKVSLSMLKARIDSEVAAHAPVHAPRALSPVADDARASPPAPFHRPQFLDDSHVFWCHSCRGDLVIL